MIDFVRYFSFAHFSDQLEYFMFELVKFLFVEITQ